MLKAFFHTSACLALLSTAAVAQNNDETMTQEEITTADEAADTMFIEVYGETVPTYMTVGEAIERMQAAGYTNIHDFDVEWGRYEVEAIAPDGNEVEIEFDPVTGAILDVEDNWF